MKNLKTILFVIIAGVFVLQSCQQDVIEPQNEQTELTAETRIWPLIIGAVVAIVVHLSEGQWQGTNADGSNKGCSGVGSCGNHSIASGSGQGTGSTYDPEYVGDFSSPAFFAINENTGNVILGMDGNADPEAKATMFYDNEIYMSPTQIIDNPDVLDQLGLTEPVVMEEGYYEVMEDGETKYINIQYN